MPKYVRQQGVAHLPVGPKGEVVRILPGVEFESDLPLTTMYVNAFEEVKPKMRSVGNTAGLTEEEEREAIEQYLANKAKHKMDNELEPTKEEREIALSGLPDERPQVVKDQRTTMAEFAKSPERAPDLSGAGEPAKAKAVEPEDEDEDDITDEFKAPKGVKVFKGTDGHVIRKGDKTLTEKPLRTRPQVDKFLKEME